MTPEQQKDLGIGQLAEDLTQTMRNLVTRAGAVLYAEALYDRGVRSTISHPEPTSTELKFRRAEMLPEAVQRVIRLVAVLHQHGWESGHDVFTFHGTPGGGTKVSLADLEATLAEIPDVSPRYPTIWAYEQACRTIRERDDRITRALELAEQDIPGPAVDEADHVLGEVARVLRLRMPRVEPATPEQLSEVTRALEMADQSNPDAPIEAWVSATVVLAAEIRRIRESVALAEIEAMRKLVTSVTVVRDETGAFVPCGTCSTLTPPRVTFAVGRSERGWPRCAPHLVEDALEDAGHEKDTKRCSSCFHLASSHYEDGSGCSTTIRDVGMGVDSHCPCTFDARSQVG